LASSCATVDSYIRDGDLQAAEDYCHDETPTEARACWKKLADANMAAGQCESAAEDFAKAGGHLHDAKTCFEKAANLALQRRDYDKAAAYYEKAGVHSDDAKTCFEKAADLALQRRDYDKAATYYEKAGSNEGLRKVADAAFEHRDYDKAATYYENAGSNEGLRKVADAYLTDQRPHNECEAVALYRKLGDQERVRKILEEMPRTSGKWHGFGESTSPDSSAAQGAISFEVSGQTITDLQVSIPGHNHLSGQTTIWGYQTHGVAIFSGRFSTGEEHGDQQFRVVGKIADDGVATGRASFANSYSYGGRRGYSATTDVVEGAMSWTATRLPPCAGAASTHAQAGSPSLRSEVPQDREAAAGSVNLGFEYSSLGGSNGVVRRDVYTAAFHAFVAGFGSNSPVAGDVDAAVGVGHGFHYDLDFVLGPGWWFNQTVAVAAIGGLGVDGITGGVLPFALKTPVRLVLALNLGAAVRVEARAGVNWVFQTSDRRKHGSEAVRAFADEMDAGGRIFIGRRPGTNARRNPRQLLLGFSYLETLGTRTLLFMVGYGGAIDPRVQ
jgi:hypothetical protein